MRIRRRSLRKLRGLIFLVLSTVLSGCGYHTQNSLVESNGIAVCVPLIRIDEEGHLRNSLIRELSSTKVFTYSSSPSRYQLIVEVLNDKIDTIGYMWDREPREESPKGRLYPSEKRRLCEAKIRLVDTESGEDFITPFYLSSHADFDFVNPTALNTIQFTDRESRKQTVLEFSRGQLDSEEGGQSGSFSPLFSDLATRIVAKLEYKVAKR